MLCEIFRRLRPFQPVEEYIYVGMGSLWFSDFVLFHRALGIRDMLSIERSGNAKDRFEANKPFGCITLDCRDTSVVLPELKWDRRYYAWLDYDDPIDKSMLLDLETVSSHAVSGTVLAITVQCHQAPDIQKATQDAGDLSPLDRFKARFDPGVVGSDISEDDLYGWPFGTLSRRLMDLTIEAALATRNLSQSDKIEFATICEIEYEDGAKMTTLVGIFVSVADRDRLQECGFDRLDFLPEPHGGPVRIAVPNLTVREIRQLEREMPSGAGLSIAAGHIPNSDAERFARMYRYFPNFAVIET